LTAVFFTSFTSHFEIRKQLSMAESEMHREHMIMGHRMCGPQREALCIESYHNESVLAKCSQLPYQHV
jgi:hypothetical protein